MLASNQYCIVRNPIGEDGKPRYGQQELRKGEQKFFLQPGEQLTADGIKKMIVLQEDEAVLLKAVEKYSCKHTEKTYKPGETWMIKGPL